MYILKNAFKNLLRNNGRNFLIGIILIVLIGATTVALIINNTTKEIINDYKNRFGSTVTLSVDFDKLIAEQKPDENGSFAFPSAPEISPDKYIDFTDSKYLKDYQLNIIASIALNDVNAVGDSQNDNVIGSIGGNNEDYLQPKAKLLSYSNVDNIPDFLDGLRKVVQGNFVKEKNECIVSSEFADENNLSVGSQVSVKEINSKKTLTLTIAGIYADATKATPTLPEGSMSLEGSYGNRRNEIIVSNEMMRELDVNVLTVDAEYILKSPDDVKNFETEVRQKGLPEEYNVNTDEVSYQKIVAPVEGLGEISITFMFVVLVIGAFILLFITSMAVRERKYEIGVLRAMGMKRMNVTCMFVWEILMLTIICLFIGIGVGSSISQPIADTMIKDQVEIAETTEQNTVYATQSIGGGDIGVDSEINPLSSINVSLTVGTIAQITLIALLLALLSSLVGVIYITKYEPIKILSERN